jgi:hypothetical protein
MEELPDVSFYVLNDPLLAAPEPDEVGIWQELARLRTENHAWRECVEGIVQDVRLSSSSVDALRGSIRQRVANLGQRLARIHHQ